MGMQICPFPARFAEHFGDSGDLRPKFGGKRGNRDALPFDSRCNGHANAFVNDGLKDLRRECALTEDSNPMNFRFTLENPPALQSSDLLWGATKSPCNREGVR
jgi:hypothetical protein